MNKYYLFIALTGTSIMYAEKIAPTKMEIADITPQAQQNPIHVEYTNYRGERAIRTIIPLKFWFGKTEYHKEYDQWLLDVFDIEKNDTRTYALKDISKWIVEKK